MSNQIENNLVDQLSKEHLTWLADTILNLAYIIKQTNGNVYIKNQLISLYSQKCNNCNRQLGEHTFNNLLNTFACTKGYFNG